MIYPALQQPALKGGLPAIFHYLDWGFPVALFLTGFPMPLILLAAIYFCLAKRYLVDFYAKDPFCLSVAWRRWRYRGYYPAGSADRGL